MIYSNKLNNFIIREAVVEDCEFVISLMEYALTPYYGGDHKAHAQRILTSHISGGKDDVGFFSIEQKMFVLLVDKVRAGLVHIVGKRQGTYKISPLIIAKEFQGKYGLGSILLTHAENYILNKKSRQIYCTVARENKSALQFFLRKAYIVAGYSDSHYKSGITEVMLYKLIVDSEIQKNIDQLNISVIEFEEQYEQAVSQLLVRNLEETFEGIDKTWVAALFAGYTRRITKDINQKYKLIFIAIDKENNVLGVAGATPKKGEPIKIMPFVSMSLPAFIALLTDIPFMLKEYGRKLYIHLVPSAEQTTVLQQKGWNLDALMPGAYHARYTTQQWSFNITGENFMRFIRVKQRFLDLIKSGDKTLEVRVGYNNIRTIQPGERITLSSNNQTQIIRVKDVRKYSSFQLMLEKERAELIVPGNSKQEVLELLQEIYPSHKERLGVVVLEITPE